MYTVNSENFAKVYLKRSFVKIKPSRIGDITLSFTDIGKSCPVREFYIAFLMCLLTLFAKIKFSRKFPNLQYRTLHEMLVLIALSSNDVSDEPVQMRSLPGPSQLTNSITQSIDVDQNSEKALDLMLRWIRQRGISTLYLIETPLKIAHRSGPDQAALVRAA